VLSQIFESIAIIKPVTSRPTSSERYFYCRALRLLSDTHRMQLQEAMWRAFQCNMQMLACKGLAPAVMRPSPSSVHLSTGTQKREREASGHAHESGDLAGITHSAMTEESPLVRYMESCVHQQLLIQVPQRTAFSRSMP
jgi:hypothetical protein